MNNQADVKRYARRTDHKDWESDQEDFLIMKLESPHQRTKHFKQALQVDWKALAKPFAENIKENWCRCEDQTNESKHTDAPSVAQLFE